MNARFGLPNRYLAGALLVLLSAMTLTAADPRGPSTGHLPGWSDEGYDDHPDRTPPREAPARERLREGTRIVGVVGTFRVVADQATFISADGKYQLVGLENLTLERIVKRTRDEPQSLAWSVDGTVTEYLGSNYLLVTRAVLRSQQIGRSARRSLRDRIGN